MKRKAAFFNEDGEQGIINVYGWARYLRLKELLDIYPCVITSENFSHHITDMSGIELIFSTWGMPFINAEQVASMKELRAVFYAAGSVKKFAQPFLQAGVTVVSAWSANAIPVAQFALAQVLLSCKGYFANSTSCRNPENRIDDRVPSGPGIYRAKVAIIGAGMIGRELIQMLKPFDLSIMVVDPYIGALECKKMRVVSISLESAFKEALVVSNHLPDLPSLKGVLNGKLFSSMRQGATFINTGRGAQVNELEMIKVLKSRPDLTALLDVTDPEPPEADSPLYNMDNVHLSSHIAGSINNEVGRMADCIIDEFNLWQEKMPLRYSVTAEMLEKMA